MGRGLRITARTGKTLLDVFVVGLLATAMLLICSRFLDASRIHVSGLDETLNDQVGYIAMGRLYADTGRLDSDIVLPATVWQQTGKNYLYLPGHYVALAVSYRLFGFGVLQSLLPNLVSFVIAAIAVFLSGDKIYGRRVGYLAAFFFILFPANVIYAFTAMSELTRVAATIVAFCVFVYLPGRWIWIAGPCLPVIPFLFRETGALLVIPFALIILTTPEGRGKPVCLPAGTHRWAKTALFLAATAIILLLVYRSDLSAGRQNLVNAFVFDPRFETIYTDAVAQQAVAAESLADWIGRLPTKLVADSLFMADHIVLERPGGVQFEIFSFTVPLVVMLIALAFGLFKRDPFLTGWGLVGAASLLMLLALYIPLLSAYVRWFLFTFAFGAIVCAWVYDRYILSRPLPRFATTWRVVQIGLLVLIFGASLYGIYRTAYRVSANDARDDGYTTCLEGLGNIDTGLLVLPYYMGDYVYHHYPVQASLLPANAPTLTLLQDKYSLGTLIAPTQDGTTLQETQLSIADLIHSGFLFSRRLQCNGRIFLAFRYQGK